MQVIYRQEVAVMVLLLNAYWMLLPMGRRPDYAYSLATSVGGPNCLWAYDQPFVTGHQ